MLPGIEFGLTALGHAMRLQAARQEAEARARTTQAAPTTFTGPRQQGAWSELEGRRLLEASSVPLAPATLATSEAEAVAAAERLGYPVVLKVCSAEIAHKSDIGGVRLNLNNAGEVRHAFTAISAAGAPRRRRALTACSSARCGPAEWSCWPASPWTAPSDRRWRWASAASGWRR